jgi:hypothetical protein
MHRVRETSHELYKGRREKLGKATPSWLPRVSTRGVQRDNYKISEEERKVDRWKWKEQGSRVRVQTNRIWTDNGPYSTDRLQSSNYNGNLPFDHLHPYPLNYLK